MIRGNITTSFIIFSCALQILDANCYDDYISRNCLNPKGSQLPSEAIASLLKVAQIPAKRMTLIDNIRMFIYQPIIRKFSLFLRRK